MIDSTPAHSARQLTVNPEIAKTLRKQTDAERLKLEFLILRDGIQDPVVVWKETGEILDGHNRVDIAAGNNAYGTVLDRPEDEYVSLPDLDAAIEYVLERQEGKRNATPQDLSYSRGKLYDRRKKKQGAPEGNKNAEKQSAQNAHFESEGKTADEVAEDSGVDQATVRRDAEYSRAVDDLTEVFGRDFQAHVLSGESKLSKSDVVMLAGELGKNDDVLASASELWAFGKAQTFKLAHMLAEIHHRGWTDTEAALWELSDSEPGEKDRVRESAPQVKHLLTMPDDETAADLVALVETGHPDVNNGKPVASVHKAHEIRKRERSEAERVRKREENRALTTESRVPEPGETFSTIVLDPPWDWGDEGDHDQLGRAKPTYETMGVDEIAALPVSRLAEENSHIYLWITNRSLPKGFRLLEAWGFRYITAITWVKPSFGMGNYFRGSTEHLLFGVRGSLPLESRSLGTHFEANRGSGGHSSKPPEAYELIESASPGPWLEMFARSERPGWKCWGAEV